MPALHVLGIGIPRMPAVRSSCRRKKSVIHSRKTFLFAVLLVNDGVLVIEVVERLRQLKRVLGTCAGSPAVTASSTAESALDAASSSFQKSLRLKLALHGFAAQFRREIGRFSPSSSSFRRMLRARTAAYWTYGPVSPSKLSAS